MTPRGYKQLQDELKRLTTVERPKIVKEIEEARAHGDISENAEFHAAKEHQGQIEARIALVNDRLGRAQVIDPKGQTGEKVRFGAIVEIEDQETGERETWQIVGEDEADTKEGRISVTSPIARALLGKEADVTVQIEVPRGTRELLLVDVRYD
ncbi:MAG TPA: transcription elongation factor GreA [Myxococcota bacterium]|jgi:transcription elongation factor GreA|nr:transcription elongation factor GreA [Myxococcota bacterium]